MSGTCTAVPIWIIAAGAGIHSGCQKEICRKFIISMDSGNKNLSLFQRLPQDFQSRPGKLRKLIQKQYAFMSQSNLTRRRIGPSSGQSLCCSCVVRAAERAGSDPGSFSSKKSCHTVYPGKLHTVFPVKLREYGGESGCDHSFSGTFSSDKKDIVETGCCNNCCPLSRFLA